MAISPQITNLVIILGMMQVSKKIPMEDPDTMNLIRAGYLLSNAIIISIYAYTHYLINKKKDLTTLKYVDTPPMGSADTTGKVVTTTVHSYDVEQMKSLYKAQMMGVGMMAVMHLYFKYTNPLLIQSIIPLKGAFEGNEIQIHLFGKPAIGDLKRPFKAAAGLMSSLGGAAAPVQDKKTIEKSEKAGRGGVKDE
ncbi:inorganic phosphate transporter-like protein pho88 [Calycina marina]|uniref:Inorganic phosphate transporter-like protein pho88 n=1 Tax=Calycina marina TaxID=1763456 RepID=A0A9P7Z242_9HELO|nr:inorganic phosphate transporter-like protein pho88 [Calycina marina]